MVSIFRYVGYGLVVALIKLLSLFLGFCFSDSVVNVIAKYRALIASLLIHLVVLLEATYEMPSITFLESKHYDVDEEQVLVLDMVEIAEVTNLEVGNGDPESKDVSDDYGKKESAASNVEDSSSNDDSDPSRKGEAVGIPLGIDGKAKSDAKDVKKSYGDSIKDKDLAFSSVLKSIKRKGEQGNKPIGEDKPDALFGRGKSTFNKSKPVTISAIDKIRSKFISCWKVPYGAKDAENLKVVVHVRLGIDGRVIATKIGNMGRYRSDPFYRVMADSAVRAVLKCSPIEYLPRDRYDLWREMEMHFDPGGMFR